MIIAPRILFRQVLWAVLVAMTIVNLALDALIIDVAVTRGIPIPWNLLARAPVDCALGFLGFWMMFGSLGPGSQTK